MQILFFFYQALLFGVCVCVFVQVFRRVPFQLLGLPGFAVWFSFFQISLRVLARWFLGVGFQAIFK